MEFKVSILMATYNAANYLSDAVDSILNQSYSDFECLILDDGSTDNTLEILEQYDDPRLKIYTKDRCEGLPKALNYLLAQTESEFVARQDADDISLPERIKQQFEYLRTNQKVCVLGTRAHTIDKNGKTIGITPLPTNVSEDLRHRNSVVHGSVMFRREIIVKSGGYDEFFGRGQDYELWQRISRCHEIAILPTVLYKFRQHLGNTRLSCGEEAALYQLLVRKIARDEISNEILSDIKNNNVTHFQQYLNRSEKAFCAKAVANMHMWNGDNWEAIQAYMKVIRYSPLQAREYLNLTLACLGPRVWKHFHSI